MLNKPRKAKARSKKDKGPTRQKDDFVSVARRLECDEDKGRFEANLRRIAKATLKPKRAPRL